MANLNLINRAIERGETCIYIPETKIIKSFKTQSDASEYCRWLNGLYRQGTNSGKPHKRFTARILET